MTLFLLFVFMAAWTYTEFRNCQLRGQLAKSRLEEELTRNVLNVTTDTLRKQRDEIERLREEVKRERRLSPPGPSNEDLCS